MVLVTHVEPPDHHNIIIVAETYSYSNFLLKKSGFKIDLSQENYYRLNIESFSPFLCRFSSLPRNNLGTCTALFIRNTFLLDTHIYFVLNGDISCYYLKFEKFVS